MAQVSKQTNIVARRSSNDDDQHFVISLMGELDVIGELLNSTHKDSIHMYQIVTLVD